ncbi:sulfatase-like hydrolase/transferase [bacterium]|nr:sulfatase-like hydrolase/transferase [bacterium]
MRLLVSTVSRFTCLVCVIAFALLEASASTNIILIVTDDQRWDTTGFMQERMPSLGRTARFPWMEGNTPNLDRLSEEGVHFDNGYGVYSLCSPARATMLTGQYPHKHGITNNNTDFPSDVVTYANLLQAEGYTTGYFGKWHMGTQVDRPGFDHVRTFYGQGKYFGTVFSDKNGSPLNSSSSIYDPQSQQSIVINVTDLPPGGAEQSIYRTTEGTPYSQSPARTLTIGQNTFAITTSVSYDRGVFFRFTSGEVEFDSLVYNGEQLLSDPGVATTIQASGLFQSVSNNPSYPYRIGLTAAAVSTWGGMEEWIDDTSTNYAVEFIQEQASAENPFMLFLGFKTPHQGNQNGVSNWYPPTRTETLFVNQLSTHVPNLDVSPPFAPSASGGNSSHGTNRNYCRTIAGIDGCVGDILDAVEAAGIDDETAIIFISDNGFFRGEHGLSDKRAAYEESIRLPFMIRHPSLQNSSGLIVNEIVSNLDIAPTILDLAGLEVPASMQGASLEPFIRGEVPNDWRDQLFIEYNHDAEFPTANVRPYISLIHEDGLKIVRYQQNASWNELFDTSISADPYEITNIINSSAPVDQQNRATMEGRLIEESYNTDFLKILQNNMTDSGGSLTLAAGEGSPFKLESSADLLSWNEEGSFEGDNEAVTISTINSAGSGATVTLTSQTVIGNSADHVLRFGSPPGIIDASSATLAVGSTTSSPSGGRNAVLIFELPSIGSDKQIHSATVAVTVERLNISTDFDADLWSLGIYDSTDTDPDEDGLIDYHEITTGNANLVKLQDAFLNDLIAGTASETQSVRVTSSPVSRLSDYLWKFYNSNPDYSGGKYLHLRVNPEIGSINDIGGENVRYTIKAAHYSNTNQEKPALTIELKDLSDVADKRFYRVRYGED